MYELVRWFMNRIPITQDSVDNYVRSWKEIENKPSVIEREDLGLVYFIITASGVQLMFKYSEEDEHVVARREEEHVVKSELGTRTWVNKKQSLIEVVTYINRLVSSQYLNTPDAKETVKRSIETLRDHVRASSSRRDRGITAFFKRMMLNKSIF